MQLWHFNSVMNWGTVYVLIKSYPPVHKKSNLGGGVAWTEARLINSFMDQGI